MVTGLVAIAVMLPVALDRTAPTASDSGTASVPSGAPSEAAPESAGPSDDAADPSRVVVIGDSLAGGADQGGAAWGTLLDQRIPDVEVRVVTTGDAGYVTSPGDPTLVELVAGTDLSEADLVVLFGSRFDAPGISDRVSAAAREAVASIRSRAPDATLAVIGPLWPGGGPPAGVRNNRDVIRAAAEAAGVPFVDPLVDGWLADATGMVGEDGVHLTDEGQVALADLVQPLLESALHDRTPTGTTAGG